ncbi:MAG: tetratricopeptide repeat-containing sensor histidine kinase, partial [Cyclobacteriaceae bacterium]|nr:tetratricopeptide repeat-containing sensor histidine kinase [Cyclobacteriaceae bacterium]
MKLYINLLLAFILLTHINTYSQTPSAFDQITKSLESNPMKAYNDFTKAYKEHKLDSPTLKNYHTLINLFHQNNNEYLVNQLYADLLVKHPENNCVEYYLRVISPQYNRLYYQFKYDSTRLFIDRVYQLAKEEGIYEYEAGSLIMDGALNWALGDMEKSFELLFQALEIAIEHKDTANIFGCYSNISINYRDLLDYENAKKYGAKVQLPLIDKVSPAKQNQFYINNGLLYSDLGQMDSARWCFRQCIKISNREDETYALILGHLNLAYVDRISNHFIESIARLDSIESYVVKTNITELILYTNHNRALAYGDMGDYKNAIYFNEKALRIATENKSENFIEIISKNLSEWYTELGDWETAFNYLKQHITSQDTLRKHSREREIGKYNAREELIESNYQKELLATSLAYENEIKENLIILIGILLLLGGGLIYLFIRAREQNAIIVRQKNDLQSVNNLKSEFFANISHELRTPLTLIQGNLASLEQSTGDDIHRKQKTSNARRNAKQLGKMIDDLLDLSKLELGQYQLNKELVSINLYIRRIVSSFDSLSEERGIKLIFKSDFDDSISAEIDTRQFEKVISNLLYNAFKFSSSETELIVYLSNLDNQIIIQVEDQGPGIPENDLPYIFDRFYRAQNQNDSPGTGLGLAIAKEIVVRHNGTLSVHSTKGVGSVFTLTLPQSKEEYIADSI